MASPNKDAKLMAKALAELILNFPDAVDALTTQYGYDTTQYDSLGKLNVVEYLIQKNANFRKQIVDLIAKMGGYRGFIDAIINAVGNVGNSITGIIDATSDSGKQVRQTMAQAELLKAQAAIEQAKSSAVAEKEKRKGLIIVATIGGVVILGGIGILAYFKLRKK
jgi:hypothetical protein